MDIELKNISYNERLSEETDAYSAALYVDGVRIGVVSNHGQGGCDMFHGDRDAYKKANDWCKANMPKWGDTGDMDTDLEIVCGDLMGDFLMMKDMKRTMRSKILFVKDGDLMQTGYKGVRKIGTVHLQQFCKSNPGVQPLNLMLEDAALELYKEHG